jgi:outer membrane protein OmpA-like peptidoglycan-associated protein
MRWLYTAFIWAVVIAVGFVGSRFYKQWIAKDRTSLADIVKKHEKAWDAAIGDPQKPDAVGDAAPPSTNDVIQASPLGQQSALRKKLSEVDLKKLPAYHEKLWQATLKAVAATPRPSADTLLANLPAEAQADARQAIAHIDEQHLAEYAARTDELATALERQFRADWDRAYQEFDDTPVPAKFAAAHVHAKLLEEKPEIKKKLDQADDQLTKKLPRVKLALDSFSGYCVFRSPEFRKNLAKKNGSPVLHLVDDNADYKKRIQALERGETPLAVFTIDALINNSALLDSPPGSIVLLLDETQGADAIISHGDALPNLDAMNRPDLTIVGVPDSPSDTLARVVRTKLNLNKVPDGCFVAADSPEDVVKQFRAASPKDPKVFVLWEPYVSQLLKEFPQAHRLADSSRFSGYIVDVLVVQKKYLKDHPGEVQAVVEAYLETLPSQRTTRGMVNLVLEDSKRQVARGKPVPLLTEEDAAQVAQGIWWKTARENYGHFGLLRDPPIPISESVDEMIKNISAVLIQTRALSRTMPPGQFVDKDICTRLQQKEDFKPRDRSWTRTRGDVWLKLRPVSQPAFEPLHFARGKSDVREQDEPALRRLAELMKGQPGYYLEIQGHHAKDTEADEGLALARAKEVQRWLQEQGGIPAERLRAVPLDPVDSQGTEADPQPVVTVALFQAAP